MFAVVFCFLLKNLQLHLKLKIWLNCSFIYRILFTSIDFHLSINRLLYHYLYFPRRALNSNSVFSISCKCFSFSFFLFLEYNLLAISVFIYIYIYRVRFMYIDLFIYARPLCNPNNPSYRTESNRRGSNHLSALINVLFFCVCVCVPLILLLFCNALYVVVVVFRGGAEKCGFCLRFFTFAWWNAAEGQRS